MAALARWPARGAFTGAGTGVALKE